MFDVGFSELLLIGVVALLVLGPERLPKAARTVGMFLRKARHSWEGLKAEVEREIDAEQLKRDLQDVPDPRRLIEDHVSRPLGQAASDIDRDLGKLK